MRISFKTKLFFSLLTLPVIFSAIGKNNFLIWEANESPMPAAVDSPAADTSKAILPYPIQDRQNDFRNDPQTNPLDLKDPSIIEKRVEYDPETGQYVIIEKIGDQYYRRPSYMSFEEFLEQEYQKSTRDYWKERASQGSLLERKGLVPKIHTESEALDRIFGGSTVDIRPTGYIDLSFGGRFNNTKNPTISERARKYGSFDFDMNIQMNVVGKIGDKLKVTTNYNTQSQGFNVQEQVKIEYTGYEDEIIQKIEAGNVSLPLRSTLISGSQRLFGIKSQLQFGRLTVTNIISKQESKTQEITIQNGAQKQEYNVPIDEYDANRHFFISQYFRNNYNQALSNLPTIKSQINITKIEVWVTPKYGATQNTRDIIAFAELGEVKDISGKYILPQNESLYQKLTQNSSARKSETAVNTIQQAPFQLEATTDFVKTFAQKLDENQYTLHPQLGYISLRQSLRPDEVLAVAFEYTYKGEVYRVGEFAQDIPPDPDKPTVLFLKMLKSTAALPDEPIWDLMMKNIYAIGAYRIDPADFKLNVFYQDPGKGEIRYIPESENDINKKPLITHLNLDNVNNQNDPRPDGVFDFIPGVTVLPESGRIIFPVVEPFGNYMEDKVLKSLDPAKKEKYTYHQLYDSTQSDAQEFQEFNKYVIRGEYQSSVSSEITLNTFNLPRGSVKVLAGGRELQEGIDYTIDYNLGRVKIINEGLLLSGEQIKIQFENDMSMGFDTKTLFGSRFDYWISDDFVLGATYMHLSERPYTQKVNIGSEPISNSIIGFDGSYFTESTFLTRMIDKLPFLDTKEASAVTVSGEYARLMPGHSKAINVDQGNKDEKGTAYIDDFEGVTSSYDLKFPFNNWTFSSTPRGARNQFGELLFPEADSLSNLQYNYNRAKLAWYTIDPVFHIKTSATPSNITNQMLSNHYMRQVFEREIFPEKGLDRIQQTTFTTFDLAYYPTEKGPYNYDTTGINEDGTLQNPEQRWGGIMRSIESTDFEAANIEFIEFWMMDPFIYNTDHSGGEMYINLGNVSEDILKDSRLFFENGLPKQEQSAKVDTTVWGRVPNTQPVVNAFDNDPETRKKQDVGLDGLSDANEKTFYDNYLDEINAKITNSSYKASVQADPSMDNYIHYLSEFYTDIDADILRRYKDHNNPENNSQPSEGDQINSSTNIPDTEDINRDNTLNEIEDYYQYRIDLRPDKMAVGQNYITDKVRAIVTLKNGTKDTISWYQFKIPVQEYNRVVGNINGFKSIRFMRMFMAGFQEEVVCRFATFELVRNQWRKYEKTIRENGEYLPDDNAGGTYFNVTSVNIEENGAREPVNYILPPGVEREDLLTSQSSSAIPQNEQSLSVQICDLQDGYAKGIYKTLNLDIRKFKRLKMFVHAEGSDRNTYNFNDLQDGDLTAFIRLGSDFTENYYELEIPLKVTPAGSYEDDRDMDREIVWPSANELNILLDSLVMVKQLRNGERVPLNVPYIYYSDDEAGKKITVVGSPDLSLVKSIMIGIRNPKDDGMAKCGEVWFNELRLAGFDEKGGWAAVGRVDVKLADLGSASVSGNIRTVGFGGLEDNIQQRSQENTYQYNAATNLELGRFLPSKSGIQIPLYAGISESISRPEYDPYDPDIKLKTKLDSLRARDADTVREYRKQVEDYTSIKSLNFSNIRKIKTNPNAKSRIWDVENLNLTLAYVNKLERDPTIASDVVKDYRGAIGYNYSAKNKYIAPFEKLIRPDKKWLRPIRDINFNLIPNTLSFRSELNRMYGETALRNLSGDDFPIDTLFDKRFVWDRQYGFKQNLTRNISFNFSASTLARIDEPEGKIDTEEEKEEIIENLLNLGRTTQYFHTTGLQYNLPINKIPVLDWVQVRTGYNANYDWFAHPLDGDTIGNTIQNNQNKQINGEFNFKNLYNKIGFLRDYNRPSRPTVKPPKAGSKSPEKEEEPKPQPVRDVKDFFVRSLLSLKRVSLTYNRNEGTILPGFDPEMKILGMDIDRNYAPGAGFIFGLQPDRNTFLDEMKKKGYLQTDTTLNYQFQQMYSNTFSGKANLEPMQDMRIDLNMEKSFSNNYNQDFLYYDFIDSLAKFQNMERGNFSMSFITWRTMIDPKDENDIPASFRRFEEYRSDISERLGKRNERFSNTTYLDTITGEYFYEGYGPYSQDVLIPAFLAAYTGASPDDVSLDVNSYFKRPPLPNWNLTYNGLSKIKFLQKYFNNITIRHGYNSRFSVNSFVSDLEYEKLFGYQYARDTLGRANFFSFYEIPMIIITEEINPLIELDLGWKNDLSTRIKIGKMRALGMSFIDYQLEESKTTDITLGAGYRTKGITVPFIRVRGKKVKLENDLNFKLDFSYRDRKTVIYKLDQDIAKTTGGVTSISIAPSVDYIVNNRVNVRLFYDKKINIPHTSASYENINTFAGINVRLTIGQ